jgi:hypothetical protein
MTARETKRVRVPASVAVLSLCRYPDDQLAEVATLKKTDKCGKGILEAIDEVLAPFQPAVGSGNLHIAEARGYSRLPKADYRHEANLRRIYRFDPAIEGWVSLRTYLSGDIQLWQILRRR